MSANQQAGELSTNPFVFDGRGDCGNRDVLPKRPFAASQERVPNGVPDRVLSSKRGDLVGGVGEDEYIGVATPIPGLSGVSSSMRNGNESGDDVKVAVDHDRGLNRDARHGGALRTPGRWGSRSKQKILMLKVL